MRCSPLSVLGLFLLLDLPAAVQGQEQRTTTHRRLSDGVELWTAEANEETPHFFARLQTLFGVALGSSTPLPFGRSVAFLVGVSDYQHIRPQLPFVQNDLRELREFLLEDGGFDEVYVVSNTSASRELIEDYMANRFRKSLREQDRLLFYYSGHGADFGGTTGYMQLAEAEPDDFANHVIPIDRSLQWSRFIKAKHIVFIYDSCASGLAFTARAPDSETRSTLVSALSGGGSRTVITAGTADERTYEVRDRDGSGNGVFTRALLDAARSGRTDRGRDGFLTIDELFAETFVGVKAFAATHGKTVTPRMWRLEESRYRGTFVFLSATARYATTRTELPFVRRASSPRADSFGSVSVSTELWAEVSLDEDRRTVTPAFFGQVPVGEHRIRITRAGYKEQVINVLVEEGKTKTLTVTMENDGSS